MLVIAAPGLKVPQEEKPRAYITDTPPEGEAGFMVPESAYYLRRVAEGDLVVVDAPEAVDDQVAAAVAQSKSKKGAK